MVEDSLLIPKVNPKKDFRAYLRLLNDGGASEEYQLNHPEQLNISQDNSLELTNQPFSIVSAFNNDHSEKKQKEKRRSSVDLVAESLRRSTSSVTNSVIDLSMLPPHYFDIKFVLPASNFTIQTQDDVVSKKEDMNYHLDVVEKNLTKTLGNNY